MSDESANTAARLIRRHLDRECSDAEAAELNRLVVVNREAAEALVAAARFDATLTAIFRSEERAQTAVASLAAPLAKHLQETGRWSRFRRRPAAILAVAAAVILLATFPLWRRTDDHVAAPVNASETGRVLSGTVLVD